MRLNFPGAIALFGEASLDNDGFAIFSGLVCLFALVLDFDDDLRGAGRVG